MNARAMAHLMEGAAIFGIELPREAADAFSRFAAELQKWSRKINLTTITGDEDVAVKHFLDSLSVANVVKAGGSLADIGSGAGFPAIPLKIAVPCLRVTSIDAVEKKIFFQRHVARLLGLSGFDAVHGRGEQLRDRYPRCFDWVISRAFSDIPTFVGMALPILKEEGVIIAMKGKSGHEEADRAATFLSENNLIISERHTFCLPGTKTMRILLEIKRR